MFWRGLYLLLCTLVLAGLVHITVVLLIPEYGTRDAHTILAQKTEPWQFQALAGNDEDTPLTDVDPFFAYGACRFDLSESGVWLKGPKIDLFWSATVLDENGTVAYSLNARTAIDNKLDLILLDQVQTLRLRESQPSEVETSIIVEAQMKKGFVVVRVLRPDASWGPLADEFMKSITCDRYLPPAAAPQSETAPAS